MNCVTLYFRGLGLLCMFLLIHQSCCKVLWSYKNTSGQQTYEHFQKQCWESYLYSKNKASFRGWGQKFQSWFNIHGTLAWSSIIIKGKAWVACAGVGTGHIGTQLLAVAVATFVYIYRWERWKGKWFVFSHADTKQQTHWVNSTNNSILVTAKLSGVQTQSSS